MIYTGFSKAFDRVAHGILQDKLKAYRITDTFLNWLSSYLHIRFFFVAVNRFKSVVYELTFGVPQGSYMGPILFNIFMYGLSNSRIIALKFLCTLMTLILLQKDSIQLQ